MSSTASSLFCAKLAASPADSRDVASVPARHIYEGAAPCPYCLAPCPIIQRPARIRKKKKIINCFFNFFIFLQNVIAVFVFSNSRCKNACNCLQICTHVFINCPQNCAKTSFHSRAGLWPNFGRSCVKVCFTWSFAQTTQNRARILVVVPNFFCTLPFSQPSWNTGSVTSSH